MAAAVLAFGISGCGRKSAEKNVPPPAPTAVVNPATAGTISGNVVLDGPVPSFHPIDMSAEPACVQANPTPVIPPIVVTGEHGALANVVVYVKAGLGEYRYDVPQTPALLDQKGCMYDPRVVAVVEGQPLEIRNSDATVHNIHPMPRINHAWNRSEEPGSPPFRVTFDHPETAIPIMCNVHPWMRAYLFVFDNPYFAVTAKTGTFELKGLPPGTYTIEAWQEHFGIQDQTVTLGPKESKSISFVYRSDRSHWNYRPRSSGGHGVE